MAGMEKDCNMDKVKPKNNSMIYYKSDTNPVGSKYK